MSILNPFKSEGDRGFLGYYFLDRYGSVCNIQESSLATEDAIWLGVDDPSPEYKHRGQQYRMHLTREMVAELLPHLTRFVETGKLAPGTDDR